MSLLMDALKKAEQAKQQGPSTGATPEAPPLSLEPTAPEASAPSEPTTSLPELPRKLETLDEEFIAHARQTPTPPRARPAAETRPEPARRPSANLQPPKAPPADAAGREAVRNAFAAKQPVQRNSRAFGVAVGAVSLVAVAGIGIYFWLQLRPARGLAPVGLATAPVTRPAAPVAPVAHASSPAATPAAVPVLSAAEPAAAQVPAKMAAGIAPAPRPPASTPTAERPIRITTSRLQVNPALARGYDAFQTGDVAAARAAYARVLEAEPRNTDALQGAAAVALREGRVQDAETYYLRMLEADPRDAAAQAGLLGLRGQGDPVANESRLKTLLAVQPELPVLHFALGNLYARQNRWSEAQQAYFKAMSGDAENPDYLFNLAVSLDQLHQGALAAEYYRKALAAAATRPAAFDPGRASVRLRDLQTQEPAGRP